MIGSTIERYLIEEKLPSGGMGDVFLAKDTRLHRTVAIKFPKLAFAEDPELLGRFQMEIRTISSLNHPRICTIFDSGEYEGRPFIVMERLVGTPLTERMKGLRLVEAVVVIGQIAEALECAHAHGIIHRDVKPSNIFVDDRLQSKLLDFGLAKLLSTTDSRGTSPTIGGPRTRPGDVLGTPAYLSPEQILGQRVDERADLFSLGVVLYEATTGRLPFKGNGDALRSAILRDAPQPLEPDLPQELERILRKALAKTPHTRYSHASEIRRDLERLHLDLCAPYRSPIGDLGRHSEMLSTGPKNKKICKPTWGDITEGVLKAVSLVSASWIKVDLVVGAGRGGAIIGAMIAGNLGHKEFYVLGRAYSREKNRMTEVYDLGNVVVKDRNVLLVFSEVQTGRGLREAVAMLKKDGPAEVRVVALYRSQLVRQLKIDYPIYDYVFNGDSVIQPWYLTQVYRAFTERASAARSRKPHAGRHQ